MGQWGWRTLDSMDVGLVIKRPFVIMINLTLGLLTYFTLVHLIHWKFGCIEPMSLELPGCCSCSWYHAIIWGFSLMFTSILFLKYINSLPLCTHCWYSNRWRRSIIWILLSSAWADEMCSKAHCCILLWPYGSIYHSLLQELGHKQVNAIQIIATIRHL